MTATHNGGTFARAMAANGMPFATMTVCATVVRVASIIVAVESTWVGYSDGVRPRSGPDIMLLRQRRQMWVSRLCYEP